MTKEVLQQEISVMIPGLLQMASDLTWNKIPANCLFIHSEIRKHINRNLFKQREQETKENNKKIPVSLEALMPELLAIYDNLYDINLEIYKATKHHTIIDIRYFLKSSLDEQYRQTSMDQPPMLHAKVSIPNYLSDKKKKFDINCEHRLIQYRWRMFLARLKFKIQHRDRLKRINNTNHKPL